MMTIDGMNVLTAAQMRAAEDRAIAAGDSVDTLMARAGGEVACAVRRLSGNREILVLCGPGNNGGDGYVAAVELVAMGLKVRVAASAPPKSDAAIAARARWTGPVESLTDTSPAPVVLDALFGSGLSRPLDDAVAAPLRRLIEQAHLTIAVDLPSGVATDNGAVLSDLPKVDVTLALGAVKPSHLLFPAAQRCGAVRLLEIGVVTEGADTVLARPVFAPPSPADHKYSRGMVAVLAGAMPGATVLAASAAARLAGYVLLLGASTDRVPHAIVRRRWSAEALADPRIGAVVIGPGLGRDETAREKLEAALSSDRPLVIDGDALHLLTLDRVRGRTAPVILTPHEGEFAAMFGKEEMSKIERARAAATDCGATLVLKGADTVIAHHDGRTRIASESASWLATAGSGDTLAGIIGALLAHERSPFDAASDGVWMHTEAARLAGPAFIADELAAHLPRVVEACR
jgi:hydroxyethylthiazole kinase-like uncharacterized protein yjeF